MFKKRELVQTAIDRALQPVYEAIQQNIKPPVPLLDVGLTGLAVLWAANEPQILEREINGDSCFHDYFHAIGSGSQTAYAVFRTLGGKRLSELDERKALMALLRILHTSVSVEVMGVSEPLSVLVIESKQVRPLSQDEIQAHLQSIGEWESDEQERFFSSRI